VADRYRSKPLSGFRVPRTSLGLGVLPPGFGVEAHLNLAAALSHGAVVSTVDLGSYRGRFAYKPRMGDEVARALLNLAERHGRL
jgi:hypothetical protein